MTKYLNKFSAPLSIFLLMLLLSHFANAQQEEPKRVSVIVKATEVTPTKEIIQLPATNAPQSTQTRSTKKTVTSSTQTPKNQNTKNVKTTVEAKSKTGNTAASVAVKKPVENPSGTTPATRVALSKNSEAQAKTAPNNTSSATSNVKTSTPQEAIRKSDTVSVSSNPTNTLANQTKNITKAAEQKTKIDNDTLRFTNDELTDASTSSKASSFSYIWIGVFLIVAGVVLGMLFGKPAFLISFVGIVFITLGLML